MLKKPLLFIFNREFSTKNHNRYTKSFVNKKEEIKQQRIFFLAHKKTLVLQRQWNKTYRDIKEDIEVLELLIRTNQHLKKIDWDNRSADFEREIEVWKKDLQESKNELKHFITLGKKIGILGIHGKILTKHQFHLFNPTILSFSISIWVFLLSVNLVLYLYPTIFPLSNSINAFFFHIASIGFILTLFAWFASIVYESGKGFHTLHVQRGLRAAFLLFLVSEAMLFFAFFWSYFHFAVNPSISINHKWPPFGAQHLDTWGIPLINTLLLLSSGWSANQAHKKLLSSSWNYKNNTLIQFLIYLNLTLILGSVFLASQYIEYRFGLQQSWSSNVYWSVFYTLTGFHGVHVIVGTLFLQYNYVREVICNNGLFLLNFNDRALSKIWSCYFPIHMWLSKKLRHKKFN